MEPFYILGENVFNQVDIRIRVKGGGSTSQVYAIRQAIAKAIVHTIKNLLMKQQRKRSRKNLFNLTVLSWLLIQDVQNQRNSVDMVLVQDSKNLIVKSFVLHFMIALRI